jgi:hypothetical protein
MGRSEVSCNITRSGTSDILKLEKRFALTLGVAVELAAKVGVEGSSYPRDSTCGGKSASCISSKLRAVHTPPTMTHLISLRMRASTAASIPYGEDKANGKVGYNPEGLTSTTGNPAASSALNWKLPTLKGSNG